jgi:hypothetical protein
VQAFVCFVLNMKHCGTSGGYKLTFGSGTRLLVQPGEYSNRAITERLKVKCLHVSRNGHVIKDGLAFGGHC